MCTLADVVEPVLHRDTTNPANTTDLMLVEHMVVRLEGISTGQQPGLPLSAAPVASDHERDTAREVLSTIAMSRDDDSWTAPQKPPFSIDGHDIELMASADGLRLLFFSTRPVPGGRQPKRNNETWQVERTQTGWGPAHLVDLTFERNQFMMYTSQALNQTLYFTSMGGIFSAKKSAAGYMTPTRLSDEVNGPKQAFNNTAAQGWHPFIAWDESYIIFDAVAREDRVGMSDMYISFRKPDGSWTKSRNMGPTVNSKRSEQCPSVSSDGKYLFYKSDRNGNDDIMWVDASIITKLKHEELKAR